MEIGESLRLPNYGANDKYYEDIVSLAKSMIIEETEDHIVINKLPNIASQPGTNTRSNIPFILNHYLYEKNCEDVEGESRRSYLVHRLDKGTSGAMVVALNPNSSKCIIEQFKAKNTLKQYTAVCLGLPIFGNDFLTNGNITGKVWFDQDTKMYLGNKY